MQIIRHFDHPAWDLIAAIRSATIDRAGAAPWFMTTSKLAHLAELRPTRHAGGTLPTSVGGLAVSHSIPQLGGGS